eukprot:GHVO01014211.1.p1 GENE.GHVO01014211.1~~GHVO01014211.1.p1  ORF type:complete len:549 (-),score=94.52 GHVO01014211.1:131-1735(-)
MFEGLVMHVLPLGPELSIARKNILEKKIRVYGGRVIEQLGASNLYTVSHIVMGNVDLIHGYTQIDLKDHPRLKIVSADWISECLNLKRLIDISQYGGEIGNLKIGTSTPAVGTLLDGPEKSVGSDDKDSPYFELSPTEIDNDETPPQKRMKSLESLPNEHQHHTPLAIGGKTLNKRQQNVLKRKAHFACQSSQNANQTDTNLNPELTKLFLDLATAYESRSKDDQWRQKNYKLSATIVKNLKFRIENETDLEKVKLGKKTKEKAVEFLRTGALEKLKHLQDDPRQMVITEFTKIHGVAFATAEKFVAMGFKTLDDLRQNSHVLNSNQKIGLELVDDLNTRMKRDEASSIIHTVLACVDRMFPETFEALPCGSYRRGKETCGDVDILLAPWDRSIIPTNELQRICHDLRQSGFLTHDLNSPERFSKPGRPHVSQSYMGVCRISENHKHRRIDIKIYPRHEYALAILYFTGSGHFNRSMRLYARKLGFSLSDHDLVPVVRVRDQKYTVGKSIPCENERDVFDVLGLEYKDPSDRDV